MVTRAAEPRQLRKKPPRAICSELAFYSSAPCRSHHSSLTIKTLKSNSSDIGITARPFWGHVRKKGCASQYSCQSTRPSPRSCPLSVSDAHIHTYTHTHPIGRGICWGFGCDLFKMCSLCPLIQLSKDLLQQLLFSLFSSHFSLSHSLFVSKFLFISSSWILPGVSEMLLLSVFHQQGFL